MVCFHHAYSAFDSVLTDKQKEGFFTKYPGLRWIEEDYSEVDKHLNKLPVPALEMWVEELIKFTAKHDEWTDSRIKGCRFI